MGMGMGMMDMALLLILLLRLDSFVGWENLYTLLIHIFMGLIFIYLFFILSHKYLYYLSI